MAESDGIPATRQQPAERTDSEVSAVSLQTRILPFWREHPRLWFAQFEAIIAYQKIGEEQKYSYVLGVLQQQDVEQISDLILNPPEKGRYSELKARLLSVYEESESRQLQRLLGGIERGDQKPTQLLRRMRDLAASRVPDQTLRIMWMGQMPSQIRTVLSISEDVKLDDLATMADRMMEQVEPYEIAAISRRPTTTTSDSNIDAKLERLHTQLDKLTLEVAELRRTQYRDNPRFRSRSRSTSSRRKHPNYGGANGLCYYHRRFGDRAQRCETPCAKRQAEN